MNIKQSAAVNKTASTLIKKQTAPRGLIDGYAPRIFVHAPPAGPRSVQGEHNNSIAQCVGSPGNVRMRRVDADETMRYML